LEENIVAAEAAAKLFFWRMPRSGHCVQSHGLQSHSV